MAQSRKEKDKSSVVRVECLSTMKGIIEPSSTVKYCVSTVDLIITASSSVSCFNGIHACRVVVV